MAIATRFRAVNSLIIERPLNLNDACSVLQKITTSSFNCFRLTHLDMAGCQLGSLGFESICCFPNLSKLHISDNPDFFDYHLADIAQACPMLQELGLVSLH